MAVDANVILRIGTALGPGGFASLQAGISLVKQFSGQIAETIKEMDRFHRVMQTTDMDMVAYADSASQGQIDTMELMKAYNELHESMKVTGTLALLNQENFKMLSVAATDLAQKIGEEPTDAFRRLIDSIAKGTPEALKQFGIKLKEGGDMAVTQSDAFRKLGETYGNVEIKAGTLSEKIEKLKNTTSTFLDLIWSDKYNKENEEGAFSVIGFVLDELSRDMESASRNLRMMRKDFSDMIIEGDKALRMLRAGKTPEIDFQADEILKQIDPEGFAKLQALRDKELTRIRSSMATSDAEKAAIYAKIRYERDVAQSELEPWEYDLLEQQSIGYEEPRQYRTEAGGRGGKPSWIPAIGEDVEMEQAIKEYAAALGQPIVNLEQYKKLKARLPEGFGSGMQPQVPLDYLIGGVPDDMPSSAAIAMPLKYDKSLVDAEYAAFKAMEKAKDDAHQNWRMRFAEQKASKSRFAKEYMESVGSVYDLIEDKEKYIEEVRRLTMMEREDWETGWRAAQLQFADDFKKAWESALNGMSAGAMAASASLDLMKKSWQVAIDTAIYGSKSIRAAMREVLHEIGRSLAIEAGWRGAMELVHAAAAAASKRYGEAAQHLAAGAAYIALAAAGFTVAKVTAPKQPSVSTNDTAYSYGGGYSPSYGGEPARSDQKITIVIKPGKGIFDALIDEGQSRYRSGQVTFQMAS